jgi:hypothetical protein
VIETQAVPGALELLESGELDDANPRYAELAGPGSVRAPGDSVNVPLWQAMLDRLRGYRRDEVVLDGVETWLPLVELVPPRGGRASCVRKVSETRGAAIGFKIFGTGFGSTLRATLETEIEFSADETPVALTMPVRLTAVRYLHDRFPPLLRVDVRDGGGHLRLASLPEPPPVSLDSPGFELVRRVELSQVSSPGTFAWTTRAEEGTTWSWSFGATLPGIGEASTTVEAQDVRDLEVGFELPYGHDYVIYQQDHRPRLAPRCATLSPSP